MLVEYFDGEMKEQRFGTIMSGTNAGEKSYVELEGIKSVDSIGNPGFNMDNSCKKRIEFIELNMLNKQVQIDTAKIMGLPVLADSIASEMLTLTAEKGLIVSIRDLD